MMPECPHRESTTSPWLVLSTMDMSSGMVSSFHPSIGGLDFRPAAPVPLWILPLNRPGEPSSVPQLDRFVVFDDVTTGGFVFRAGFRHELRNPGLIQPPHREDSLPHVGP